MPVKKMTAKRPARKPKPSTVKRSAVDGRYGSGEKAAEKLARRIVKALDPAGHSDESFIRHAIATIKAELLAATTVVERQAGKVGAGWVLVPAADIDVQYVWVAKPNWIRNGSEPQYVHLIPATPPRTAKGKGGGK